MVEPGRRCLGDRYELHHMIAAGGMGQVWRGRDVALHRPVAVKVLRSEYTGDPTFLERFRAEARHAASLSHPNIAAVFDYGEECAEDGTGETLAYLVMELVEGEPLSAVLARERGLDTDTTLALLQQTALALAEAHRAGLVHRDVKPGNILVRPDGSVKITDFGIAWSARSVALTRTGQVIGTPQYLSPEAAEGRLATPASDVYALGLIGYECLSGHPAFDGDNAVTIALKQVRQEPEPLPGELPPGVRTLISRALVKDPEGRFPDGAAFAAAIDDVLAGRELAAAPETRAVAAVPPPLHPPLDPPDDATVARPPSPRRGRRLALALSPLVALLAGIGIAAAVQLGSDGRPSGTATAAEERASGSIVLDASDYVGRPVDEVAERLTALGLVVELRSQVTESSAPDRVTGVAPAGKELAAGDAVVVRYAVPPSRAGERSGGAGVTQATVGESPAPEVAEPTEAVEVEEQAPPEPGTEVEPPVGEGSASPPTGPPSSSTSPSQSPGPTTPSTPTEPSTPTSSSPPSTGTSSSAPPSTPPPAA
ncbi:protein kinase [Blastococcus sp. CCUG 61487]|uniref:serine/threonine-protein kinase n=1 Tax=Blastococcus sp. CCUG 61487 TaxID=1840703 RepID=UPI00201E06E6|nr:protein kinase [Blastococcus sp. CCUG 61487]